MNRNPATLSIPAPERIISRDVLITSAQLLALNNAPQTVVPAPPTGFALVFEGAVIHKPAGTAYGGIHADENLSFRYTDGSGGQAGVCETEGFLDQTTAQTRYVRPHNAASGVSDLTPPAAAALVLHMLTGEITTGNSPLHVRVFYRIIPAAAFAA